MKPCLICGTPSERTRCPEHTIVKAKKPTRARGYGTAWRKLSERARRLQPWCTDCGATTDLQTDHTPAAWDRHNAGLPVRLQDVDVTCGPCNRARGAARGERATRGDTPPRGASDPSGKAQGQLGIVLSSGGSR